MGDHDHRRVDLLLQLRELDARAQPEGRVEVGKRLVEQEQLGLLDQGAPDGHALALAAGQLAGLALEQLVDLEHARGIADAALDVGGGNARVAEPERHVLADAHVRIERVMLEDHGDAALAGRQRVDALAFEPDLAGVGGFQAGDDAQQGRLAGSGRTEESDELASLEAQRNVVEHRRRAKAFPDADQLQARHAALPQRGTLTSTLPRGNGCRGDRPAEQETRCLQRRRLVELRGIEPLTSAVRLQRSPI